MIVICYENYLSCRKENFYIAEPLIDQTNQIWFRLYDQSPRNDTYGLIIAIVHRSDFVKHFSEFKI